MKLIAAFLACVFVVGCGADGAPLRPSANFGVGVGTSGVSTSGSVSIGVGN